MSSDGWGLDRLLDIMKSILQDSESIRTPWRRGWSWPAWLRWVAMTSERSGYSRTVEWVIPDRSAFSGCHPLVWSADESQNDEIWFSPEIAALTALPSGDTWWSDGRVAFQASTRQKGQAFDQRSWPGNPSLPSDISVPSLPLAGDLCLLQELPGATNLKMAQAGPMFSHVFHRFPEIPSFVVRPPSPWEVVGVYGADYRILHFDWAGWGLRSCNWRKWREPPFDLPSLFSLIRVNFILSLTKQYFFC